MSVRVVVDSTANINEEIAKRLYVVPLTVHFGDEEFIDGVTISCQEFYERLIESDVMPRTSQATPNQFIEAYNEITANGDSAVVITLAAKLSGTYQSATIAAGDFDNFHVVDSESVTIGAGVLAELAIRLVDEGLSAVEIAERLKVERKNIRIVALLDTLEYLQRGGRISKTAAFVGGLLSIKPVISVQDGEIQVLGKARGSKQGNNLLVQEIEKVGGVDFDRPVLLGYTGLSDLLLQKYVEDSEALWKHSRDALHSAQIGSVVGTHAGPGAIAVAFFKR